MATNLPDPFHRIHRLIGRRSHPVDWPESYEFFDAYDGDGEFLLTVHYKALTQLLNGQTFPHTVLVQFDGAPDRDIAVRPETSLDLTITLNFGDFKFENPDEILSKVEILQFLCKAMTVP